MKEIRVESKINITVEDKIEVLDTIYMDLFQYIAHGHTLYPPYEHGLCFKIIDELKRRLNIKVSIPYIKLYFKDFRHYNALNFGASETVIESMHYWWNTYDIYSSNINRLKFLEWMIERLKTGKEGYEQ